MNNQLKVLLISISFIRVAHSSLLLCIVAVFRVMGEMEPSDEEQLLIERTTPVKAARLPQYITAFIASIGGMSMGAMLAWTSPTQKALVAGQGIWFEFPMTNTEFTYIGSVINVGGMIGALIAGPICDKIGRRSVIIGSALPCILGWGVIMYSVNVYMLLVGRFVIGLFGCGVFSCACPMYTNEISHKDVRGTLGVFFQLQVNFGILFAYLVGAFSSVFLLSVVCAAIPAVLSVCMLFMPESPYYHLIKKDEGRARTAMAKLRGFGYNIDEEITSSQNILQTIENDRVPLMSAFLTVAAKKGLVIGVTIMVLQQFSGINAVIFFAGDIFDAAGSRIGPNICSIIVGVFLVVGTFGATQIIDKSGRRPLLLASLWAMAIAHFFLGLYFYLKDGRKELIQIPFFQYLPLITLSIFIIFFSLGLGPIPWMYIGEIFPANIRGPASSIACLANWLSSFAVTSAFKPLMNGVGDGPTFWVFGAICVLGAMFTYTFVPETKGKDFEDIQAILTGRPRLATSNNEDS